jgi:hypothetical protein
MKKNILGIGVIVCISLFLAGCTQTTENGDQTQTDLSLTEIRICDAPSENFSSVFITFSEVKLFSNETGWISFLSETKSIDLMYLHMNNLTEQLGLEDIDVGNYSKLWIVVENASGVLSANGETIYFDVPSDTLKIQHLFDFQKGNNTITIEVNLDESILIYNTGDVTTYKLLPVISELNVTCANGTQMRFRNNERIINFANGTQIRVQDENTLRNMIENRKPTIDMLVNGNRNNHLTVDLNESITFDASETVDIDNDTLSFNWDFGDGTTSTEPVVNHSYTTSGTFQVTLTVSDGEIQDTATMLVTVRPGGQGDGGDNQGNILLTVRFGTQSYNFTQDDLTELPTMTGQGSYKKNSGAITGPYTYTGVSISTLLDSITSLPTTYTFRAQAHDGYALSYSMEEMNGHVMVYNDTGVEIGTGNLTMMIAYKQNNTYMNENSNGPLRIVFVDTEPKITSSGLWLSSLTEIEIIQA